MPTPIHRPFRVVAINDGAKYGFESWRYGWELVDGMLRPVNDLVDR